jgi:hypothetical protein
MTWLLVALVVILAAGVLIAILAEGSSIRRRARDL